MASGADEDGIICFSQIFKSDVFADTGVVLNVHPHVTNKIHFSLKELSPGRYEVVVHHVDFVPARKRFEIGEDRVAKELRITLDEG